MTRDETIEQLRTDIMTARLCGETTAELPDETYLLITAFISSEGNGVIRIYVAYLEAWLDRHTEQTA